MMLAQCTDAMHGRNADAYAMHVCDASMHVRTYELTHADAYKTESGSHVSNAHERMTGCTTCGGFGNRHDPIAHGTEPEECDRLSQDVIAEIAWSVITLSHEQGITDPLRLAHAIAFALKFAESDQ